MCCVWQAGCVVFWLMPNGTGMVASYTCAIRLVLAGMCFEPIVCLCVCTLTLSLFLSLSLCVDRSSNVCTEYMSVGVGCSSHCAPGGFWPGAASKFHNGFLLQLCTNKQLRKGVWSTNTTSAMFVTQWQGDALWYCVHEQPRLIAKQQRETRKRPQEPWDPEPQNCQLPYWPYW